MGSQAESAGLQRVVMVEPSSRFRKLRKVGREVDKKHGQGSVMFAIKPVPMPRLTSGSLQLDTVVGGGFPVGRITLLWGKKSSGKTYLALLVAAHAQKLCANCLEPARLEGVREVIDDDGEVLYESVGFCDCYATGRWQPRPFPEEKTDKGGLKICEVEESDADSDAGKPEGGGDDGGQLSEPASSTSVPDESPEPSASNTGARRAAKKTAKRAAKKVRRKVVRKASATADEQSLTEAAAEPLAASAGAGKGKGAQRGAQELSASKKTARKSTAKKSKKRKSTLYAERLVRLKTNSYEEFRVMLIDLERAFDPVWAKLVGVDVRLLVLHVPSTAEEAIDAYDAINRTGAIDLAIVDSIAHMTPSDEITMSAEEWRQGLGARLVNRACRKTVSAITDTYRDYGRAPTQIWINQTRASMNKFGSKEVRPGGFGQDFVNSLELRQWASPYETMQIEDDGKKDDVLEIGVRLRIHFEVKKNKTFPGAGLGSFVLNVQTGKVEEDDFIIARCESCGILKKADKGNKWLCFGQKFSTKKAAAELLLGSMRNQVRDFLLRNMMAGARGEEKEAVTSDEWGPE